MVQIKAWTFYLDIYAEDSYKWDRRINIYASVIVCSNRPANSNGMSIEEIKFAIEIGKPVVAVKITNSTASDLISLNVPVISNRKDSLENWISQNV